MEFNLADLFESLADAIGDRTALVCGERRLTFGELDERSTRLAHSLAERGIGPGAHVGLYLYNGTEFLEAMLAAFKLRAVPININYRYVPEELRYIFGNADLAAVVHQRALAANVTAAADAAPALATRIYVDDGSDAPAGTAEEFEALVEAGKPQRDFPQRSGSDLYMIYTGGTTGMPKGVMWRHEDVFFAGLQGGNPGGAPIEDPAELAQRARANQSPMATLPVAPFIHGAAQWAAWISWFGGGKVVVIPGRSMDPHATWRAVERERVQIMTIVGDAMARPLATALAEKSPPYDTSSLMVIGSAGAVFSESVKEELRRHLPSTLFIDSFGSTESGHTGSMTETRSMSASGHPRFAMTENVAVVDENYRRVEPGSGEIGYLARTGRLPIGYYKDPEKTARTFVEIEGKRWVIPGDLATVDADGMITVFGRGAVCINSGGEKIFPEEVEEVLKSHPAVEDAVVVGVADERWGQRVAAVVQMRRGKTVEPEELVSHCRSRIAGYKVPRAVHVVAEVMRQPSGKPDYKWARTVAAQDLPQLSQKEENQP